MKYKNIREEELKNKVGADFFKDFDTTEILGNIDFTVLPKQENLFGRTALLWAEAKTGNYDATTMFVQLILTIGRARTYDKADAPAFLGAFDYQKIAFINYHDIQDIFYINDFDWTVPPSNHNTKEFKLLYSRISSIIADSNRTYDFIKDEKDLKFFIKNNLATGSEKIKIRIHKNNFMSIYLKWVEFIKPIIDVDWDNFKKRNILDREFFLADLFVDDRDTGKIEDDESISQNLFVIYENQGYKILKERLNEIADYSIRIKDKNLYQAFWKRFKRPPLKDFQNFIKARQDLLVPQDIRERKGAFFTPKIWVEKSQKYITDYLGENWQDEYYIWDCAAGTGNLLRGLINRDNVWASTLDITDVNEMHQQIDNGVNLWKSQVFQFDFLNDDFSKLPQGLQDIVNDDEKRRKLIIYINPPYAESGSTKQKKAKDGVSNETLVHKKFFSGMSTFSKRELYAQFLMRIYREIPNSVIANFSKLKNLQSPYFSEFRDAFRAKLENFFLVPADTFDNVKGKFPIGFFIYNLKLSERFSEGKGDVYNYEGDYFGEKIIYSYDGFKSINDWLRPTWKTNEKTIGFLACNSNDFQNQNGVFIEVVKKNQTSTYFKPININNFSQSSVYFAIRKVIPATWINDRDQFLYPNDGWETDKEFQTDCFAYTVFSNNISSAFGTNHWIPFTENEVGAKDKFESRFMTDFIGGKLASQNKVQLNSENQNLFGISEEKSLIPTEPLQFSEEAKAVLETGKEVWKYYHSQKFPSPSGVSAGLGEYNANASLYDIREYFQGRNDKGRMNARSTDETYTQLIAELRNALGILADKIKPKVYEYGFLKE